MNKLPTRDEVVQYIVKQIDELHAWHDGSEPIETIIETYLGELMDEVEKEAIFWEQ